MVPSYAHVSISICLKNPLDSLPYAPLKVNAVAVTMWYALAVPVSVLLAVGLDSRLPSLLPKSEYSISDSSVCCHTLVLCPFSSLFLGVSPNSCLPAPFGPWDLSSDIFTLVARDWYVICDTLDPCLWCSPLMVNFPSAINCSTVAYCARLMHASVSNPNKSAVISAVIRHNSYMAQVCPMAPSALLLSVNKQLFLAILALGCIATALILAPVHATISLATTSKITFPITVSGCV